MPAYAQTLAADPGLAAPSIDHLIVAGQLARYSVDAHRPLPSRSATT